MKTDRPKIKVPLQQLDIAIEFVNLALLIFIVLYTIINYSELPETIPTHFDAQGDADGFGSKATIWVLSGISVFMYVLLYFLNKVPHLHNYMVNITEENALKNYRLSTRLIRFTNLFCLLLFAVILFEMINMAKGNAPELLGIPFLIMTITVPILGIALIFYYQNKINK